MKNIPHDHQGIIPFLTENFSSPTHWPEWNLVVSNHFNTKFYYHCLILEDTIMGICPVHESKHKRLLIKLLTGQYHFVPYGGWITKKNMIIEDNLYHIKSHQMLLGYSLPSLEEFGANYHMKDQDALSTLIVDLTTEQENIWSKDLNSKRRNMIRKAEKSCVTVSFDSKKDLGLFYKYYSEANERYRLNSLSLQFFQDLIQESNHLHIEILWANHADIKLGATVIVFDKNYSIYWLGFTVANTPNLGQGELLQWEAIKFLKKQGCKFYDLCYVQKEKHPHIYTFKKGFSRTERNIVRFRKRNLYYRTLNKVLIKFQ